MAVRTTYPVAQQSNVTIAVSTTKGAAVKIGNARFGRIKLPAAIDGTLFTLEVSHDGVNFAGLLDPKGAAHGNITFAANMVLPLPDYLFGHDSFRISFNTVQTANRVVDVRLS